MRFWWGYSLPDATRPQRQGPRDLKDLPDRKASRTTIEIGIGTGMRTRADRIRAGGTKLHHVQQGSITIQMGDASETKTQAWRSDGTLGNGPLTGKVGFST